MRGRRDARRADMVVSVCVLLFISIFSLCWWLLMLLMRRRFHLHTTRPAALIKHLFCEWNFSTHRALLCIKYICRRQWRVQIQLFASFRNLHAHTRWNERNTSDTIYMCSGLFCRRKRIYSCHIKAAAEMRRRVNIKQHIHRTAPVFSPSSAQFPLLEARPAHTGGAHSYLRRRSPIWCDGAEEMRKSPRETHQAVHRGPIRHVFPILSFDLRLMPQTRKICSGACVLYCFFWHLASLWLYKAFKLNEVVGPICFEIGLFITSLY